ncbi:hypothetical protein C8R44DRAFT_70038 [Mycena epipterygia]|nr:hypothetical protein C8R44DRAFT_70038 [Mycena epipterygia]
MRPICILADVFTFFPIVLAAQVDIQCVDGETNSASCVISSTANRAFSSTPSFFFSSFTSTHPAPTFSTPSALQQGNNVSLKAANSSYPIIIGARRADRRREWEREC